MKICSTCQNWMPDSASFCSQCGHALPAGLEHSAPADALYTARISTECGCKELSVRVGDITAFPDRIDVLAISAFRYSYTPTPHTLICALQDHCGIEVQRLATDPALDLRKCAGCWVSEELPARFSIRRIAGIELTNYHHRETERAASALLLARVRAFFSMLDIAADMGISLDTVMMPLVGMGAQSIDLSLLAVPLINESAAFLRRNPAVRRLIYMDLNAEKAGRFADWFRSSLQLRQLQHASPRLGKAPFVFISYSSADLDKAKLLYQLLCAHNIPCWYAKQDILCGSYAGEIARAIGQCTHFICLISHSSMQSHHVLNEIDLAFQRLNDGVLLLPYFVESSTDLEPSFKYYLSTMQWNYGTPPPLESRMDDFIHKIFET